MKTIVGSEEKTEEFKIGRELWLVAKAAIPVIVAEFCRLFMNVIDSAFIVRFCVQPTLFSTEIEYHTPFSHD
jgi:Na+-driven multidrug efflux pump